MQLPEKYKEKSDVPNFREISAVAEIHFFRWGGAKPRKFPTKLSNFRHTPPFALEKTVFSPVLDQNFRKFVTKIFATESVHELNIHSFIHSFIHSKSRPPNTNIIPERLYPTQIPSTTRP
jgi:hypothetical protein